jgi:4-diphosphocytidyl-2-C-methyl-D-erythritol kinase
MSIELLTPAKINLGLEVTGKRDDGFHDIATVFQTISVFDRLQIETSDTDSVQIVDRVVQIEANLAERALERARAAGLTRNRYHVGIRKRIPVAAGLGGASADAAAVLAALAADTPLDRDRPGRIALDLGSDVPFLLRGGAALATSRGEVLEPLPSLRACWLVLASPEIELERKTARLYGALTPADFSDGDRVRRVAASLRNGTVPAPADLDNAFSRPIARFVPHIGAMIAAFEDAGAPFVALTGAGPTQYTITTHLHDAMDIAAKLMRLTPIPLRALMARPVATGIRMRRDKT